VSDPIVVLDAGVVDQIVVRQEFRWVLRELVEDGWVPIIPTVTLAETITGRATDAPVNQAIKRVGCTDTPEATARLAGNLRFEVERAGHRRLPSGIDAIVAAHAAESGTGVVFTADLADLRRLLADTPGVRIEKP